MYPLIFKPIYKKMIWGGEKLKTKYNRDIPDTGIGESWDVSCREKDMSIIENGALAGKPFIDVLNSDPLYYLGKNEWDGVFPLLIKTIDAKSDLSIQVHPNDNYARENENEFFGKTEMWYILEAESDSSLVIGLKGNVSKGGLIAALENGNAEKFFNRLNVKKGDIINIPAGLIHAITGGIMLLEIQQSSDITYRVYDYNRKGLDGKPRELHVEKALDVSDFEGRLKKSATKGLSVNYGNNTITYTIANKYFACEKYTVKDETSQCANGEKFCIYSCVDGEAEFSAQGGTASISASRSVFIPAALGNYTIKGDCTLLKSYVPNIVADFINPLKQAGYTDKDIEGNCSVDMG